MQPKVNPAAGSEGLFNVKQTNRDSVSKTGVDCAAECRLSPQSAHHTNPTRKFRHFSAENHRIKWGGRKRGLAIEIKPSKMKAMATTQKNHRIGLVLSYSAFLLPACVEGLGVSQDYAHIDIFGNVWAYLFLGSIAIGFLSGFFR
jgi:hypothetical protein